MMTTSRDLILQMMATPAANAIKLLDSWTRNERLRQSSPRTNATRRMAGPKLFRDNIKELGKARIGWLEAEPHWLDADRKYTVVAPQTHLCGHHCQFRDRLCTAHESAARERPSAHGRLDAEVTLVRTGSRALVAKVRLRNRRQGAASVQLRLGQLSASGRRVKNEVRLLSYLGTQDDIALGLSGLAHFLGSTEYVRLGLERAQKARHDPGASYQPNAKKVMPGVETYNLAGSPLSPERLFWNPVLEEKLKGLAGLVVRRAWAERPLVAAPKAPTLKAR